MNIIVFDVPADSGGALAVLNEFYNEVKSFKDKSINWVFVISKPNLQETENIKVLRFPWIKKNWGYRLYFDNVVAPKLVKKYNADKVFSMQNTLIPHTDVEQVLYIHQSLPFIEYKFTIREDKLLWIYQNLIGKKIINSIGKVNKVIVQTKWMRKACIGKSGIEGETINVISPKINIDIKRYFEPNEKSFSTFFYPASGFGYKNHKLIVEACKKLKNENIEDFKVIFTLNGDENNLSSQLLKEVKEQQLPIEFIGSITRDEVFELYTRSVLIFPSYVETFGLPMLEAKLHRGIILASNCPFSHEILDKYTNAYFFNPFDINKLVGLMRNILENKIKYNNINNQQIINLDDECKSLIDMLI